MKVHIYRIVNCNQNNYHSRSSTSSAAETFILIRKVHFCWTFCDLYPVSGSCYGHQDVAAANNFFPQLQNTNIYCSLWLWCNWKLLLSNCFPICSALSKCYNKLSVSGFKFHRKVTNWQSFINEWVGRVTERKGNLVHYSGFRKKQARAGFDR